MQTYCTKPPTKYTHFHIFCGKEIIFFCYSKIILYTNGISHPELYITCIVYLGCFSNEKKKYSNFTLMIPCLRFLLHVYVYCLIYIIILIDFVWPYERKTRATLRILVAQKKTHRYCLVQAIPTQHIISYLKHTRSVDENFKKSPFFSVKHKLDRISRNAVLHSSVLKFSFG